MSENGSLTKELVKMNAFSHPRNTFIDERGFLSSTVRRCSTAQAQNVTKVQVVTSDRLAGPYFPTLTQILNQGSLGFGKHLPCTYIPTIVLCSI